MRIVPFLALAALTGCSGTEGLWVIQLPVMSNYDCEIAVEENFDEANPPDATTPTEDWLFVDEATVSDQLLMAEMFRGADGKRYLLIDDVLYPGEKADGGYTFEWTGSEVSTYTEDFVPSPYTYNEEVAEETTVTISLFKNKGSQSYSGKYDLKNVFTESYAESDEWDNEVLLQTGQINNVSTLYLVGTGNTNERGTPECNGATCTIDISADCRGSVDITAELTDLPRDSWDAHSEATQPAGT